MRPVDAKHPVTLGYRQKMKSRPSYIHRGVDYGTPVGSTVRASKGGRVVHAGRGGMGQAFGIHVVVKTSDGIYVIVAHLSSESVSVGQQVVTGQVLGKSGATGNVTGPHVHYGEFTSYSYLADRKPKYLDDAPTPAPAPKPTPKPAKKPKTLFRFGQWSLAGFDVVYGQKNWDKTVDGVVKEIARLKARVWSLTEVPGPKVKSFDASLRKRGLKVVISNNGRTIVAEQDVKVGRTKAVTLKEKGPANDDKQIVLAELWPDGQHAWIFEAGHYEYRDGAAFDKVRVTQGEQAKAATLAFAKECGVPSSRIIFGDDENSATWVLEQAFKPDFVDAIDVAYKPTNKVYATIVGWLGKTPKGSRTDRIKVHVKRPVAAARVSAVSSKRKVTDHVPTVADIGAF